MAKKRVKKKKSSGIEDRIVSVSIADPYLKMLVYGRNKQGKTRFAGTAPDLLMLDVNEKGTKSIRHTDADVLPVEQWEDFGEVMWYLRAGGGKKKYKSLCVDTITGMQHMAMRYVLDEAEDRDPYRIASMPDRQAWGKVSELMKPLLLDFRNLNMHVIYLAQERIITDDDGIVEGRVPDLSPGSRGVAMGAVDIIGRIYQKEVRKARGKKEVKAWEPRMLVGPHSEYEAGYRILLPRILKNPTVPQILEAIEGVDGGEEDQE